MKNLLSASFRYLLIRSLQTDDLEAAVLKLKDAADIEQEAYAIRDTVLIKMSELRAVADEAETLTAEDYWPFPTYGELLFGVKQERMIYYGIQFS